MTLRWSSKLWSNAMKSEDSDSVAWKFSGADFCAAVRAQFEGPAVLTTFCSVGQALLCSLLFLSLQDAQHYDLLPEQQVHREDLLLHVRVGQLRRWCWWLHGTPPGPQCHKLLWWLETLLEIQGEAMDVWSQMNWYSCITLKMGLGSAKRRGNNSFI